MDELEYLKKDIEILIENYEAQVEPDYYLGMSSESSSYEDGRVDEFRDMVERGGYYFD